MRFQNPPSTRTKAIFPKTIPSSTWEKTSQNIQRMYNYHSRRFQCSTESKHAHIKVERKDHSRWKKSQMMMIKKKKKDEDNLKGRRGNCTNGQTFAHPIQLATM